MLMHKSIIWSQLPLSEKQHYQRNGLMHHHLTDQETMLFIMRERREPQANDAEKIHQNRRDAS